MTKRKSNTNRTLTQSIGAVAPDGSTAAAPPPRRKRPANKRTLTEGFVGRVKPPAAALTIWDLKQRGLALRVMPSGSKSWFCVYSRFGRPRWYHIGSAHSIGLADARRLAARVMVQVAEGKDPASDRRAERSGGSFGELADRYLEHSKRVNKSWAQGRALIERRVLPRWGKLQTSTITRSDIKALMASIDAPILANQVLASVSAVFTWAMKEELATANPCRLVDRNPTTSRERILSESEIPKFWAAFGEIGGSVGAALKAILLTGQRPGEIAHMRHEHIADNWWTMPGEPVASLGWMGTKNGSGHRCWLPAPVQSLIGEGATGFVFAGPRSRPVRGLDQAMREACKTLGIERVTPHDLRRTFSTTVTGLGFGRDALNRVTNHREGGIASVYDRHGYADENKRIMQKTAAKLLLLAGVVALPDNVLEHSFRRG
jgi:integrase